MKKVESQVSFPKMEEEILKFWDAEKIFEKSIANRSADKLYSFYDGPPFATGTPHYGHIVASAIKDTVPRYWTMKGYRVERKWGWDCHGLPIENIAEKALGISHKKEIVEMGIEKFNDICRSKVLEYVAEWKKVMRRFGRWADMENAYKTMDLDYMESVWWVFKELWDKGLIYESYRTMHICPRCETTLSQSEVAEGYKDVKDLAVTAKFELLTDNQQLTTDNIKTYVLAWTTTPWTLPGNVALAVGKDIEYVKVKFNINFGKGSKKLTETETPPHGLEEKFEYYIVAEELYDLLFGEFGEGAEIIEKIKGANLVGKSYKPLFDYYAKDETLENRKNGWKIYHADFVTIDMGTGIAHEAPAFGEDDMQLGKRNNLPWVQHVNMDGTMKNEVVDFAGMPVKDKENPQAMDIEIIKYLAKQGTLFAKEKYEHSYPHCWRCDTPLLNYATSSWFVSVTKIKPEMLELAKNINWSPAHIKEGRWGKWLEGARDWSISRQRYWASVMPIWKCECGEMKVFGAVADLEKASGKKISDLHKHIVDEITVPCEKCHKEMKRVPDVLDTWFDSGSMPYAQDHYPFENKEKFEKTFPADFIAEGTDQTRAWFYYQHVISTAIKNSNAFQNVIVNGIALAEDGKKMAKKLKNYPDPMMVLEKYGADVLRYYLLSSPIVSAEDLNFSERELSDMSRNMFRMLWNSYSFFTTYTLIDNWAPKKDAKPSGNLLDRWILSELQLLIKEVDGAMQGYELNKATRAFAPFVDNLSNWYIRRSRKRFWKSEDDGDKENAYQTLYDVLVILSKTMAPFTPFLSEEIYRNLSSCHSRPPRLGEAGEGGNPDSVNSLDPRVKPEDDNVKEPAPASNAVGVATAGWRNASDASSRNDAGGSVHLEDYPVADESLIDEKLSKEMADVRTLVTLGLKMRAEANMKVRQPLGEARIKNQELGVEMKEILKEELNVKEIVVDEKQSEEMMLDTKVTPELKLEGEMREVVRAIQEGRRKALFNVEDRIELGYIGKENVFEKFENEIAKEVLATSVQKGNLAEAEYTEIVEFEGAPFSFSLKRRQN